MTTVTESGLDQLLALLPDNDTGEISAQDMRTITSALWDFTTTVYAQLSEVVVVGLPAAQAAITDLQGQVDALTARVAALEEAGP